MEPTWAGSLPERLYEAEVRELALPGTVAGSRCGGSGPGIRGWGARRWGGVRPGLDGGAVSRSPAVTALLVLLKQLLQGICVEHVIVVHLLLGGLRALGHQDGAAHCRDRGTQVRGGVSAAHTADSGLLPCTRALTHSGDGSGQGHQTQDLAEKRPRPQKMQGEMSTTFLKVIWNRRCQESGAEALILKMSFSPKEYTGTREALGGGGGGVVQERRGLLRSGALGVPPHSPPQDTASQDHLKQMTVATKNYLGEGT